jgi:uncharacterized protein YcbX
MSQVRVSRISRFRIKSCKGSSHDEIEVTPRGLLDDRAFAIVDATGEVMTQRKYAKMALLNIGDGLLPEMADFAEREVTLRKKHNLRAVDQGDEVAEWLSAYLNTPCRLVRMADDEMRRPKTGEGQVAFADDYAILGASVESLGDLNNRMYSRIAMGQFRTNIDFEGGGAFEEDTWRRIRIGGVVDLVGETLCARCSMPQIDQATARIGKEPAATLFEYRRVEHINTAPWKLPYPDKVYFGRNFNVLTTGTIEVGMEVEILETD